MYLPGSRRRPRDLGGTILAGRPLRGVLYGKLLGGNWATSPYSTPRRQARQEATRRSPAGLVAKHPEEGFSELLGVELSARCSAKAC